MFLREKEERRVNERDDGGRGTESGSKNLVACTAKEEAMKALAMAMAEKKMLMTVEVGEVCA